RLGDRLRARPERGRFLPEALGPRARRARAPRTHPRRDRPRWPGVAAPARRKGARPRAARRRHVSKDEQVDDLLHDAPKKLERGAPKQALKRLERARALAGDDPDVLALLGRALVELGRVEEARGVLVLAAREPAPSADALIELGWLALDEQD